MKKSFVALLVLLMPLLSSADTNARAHEACKAWAEPRLRQAWNEYIAKLTPMLKSIYSDSEVIVETKNNGLKNSAAIEISSETETLRTNLAYGSHRATMGSNYFYENEPHIVSFTEANNKVLCRAGAFVLHRATRFSFWDNGPICLAKLGNSCADTVDAAVMGQIQLEETISY